MSNNQNNQNFHNFSQHSQSPISNLSNGIGEESFYSNQFYNFNSNLNQNQNNFNSFNNNNQNGFNDSIYSNNSNYNNPYPNNFNNNFTSQTQTQQNQNEGNDNFYSINFEEQNKNVIPTAKLYDKLKFDGNVRAYYLKYIVFSNNLMPMKYRRAMEMNNLLHMLISVGVMFSNIMIYVNYVPHNMPLAKKYFMTTGVTFLTSFLFNQWIVNKIRIDSYNEMINKYDEDKIKQMIDKSIKINRSL